MIYYFHNSDRIINFINFDRNSVLNSNILINIKFINFEFFKLMKIHLTLKNAQHGISEFLKNNLKIISKNNFILKNSEIFIEKVQTYD